MSTTKLAPEHTKLHRLAGEWLGEEMVYPAGDDRGGRASSHTIARIGLDGFFVFTDYVEEREGVVPYRGHGVYGWDAQTAAYTMHWFDSMGSYPTTVARGRWSETSPASDVAELAFEQRTHQGYARYVYRFAGIDVYLFRIESSRDGREYRPFMEGKYKRVG
jgi:hypothetical protein